jgi:uncharacterized protein HemX
MQHLDTTTNKKGTSMASNPTNPCPHAASATGVIGQTHDARVTDVTATTTTTTTQPPPVVTVTTGGSGGGLTAVLLSGALLAAIVGAVVNTLLVRRNTMLEERARVRTMLAETYAAYAQYKEFPFAVRRRRADQPGEERVRLSEALKEVQARLSYYQAWTARRSTMTPA